jgi:hypothetical protein
MHPMPGFTADVSLYETRADYRMARALVHAIQPQGEAFPAQSESITCALAFQDCVTYGLCDWYFANCQQPSGGGGGGDSGGVGGGPRPPGPIHTA